MKPDYKNWVPRGMLRGFFGGAIACLVLFLIFFFSGLVSGTLRLLLCILFAAGTVCFLIVYGMCRLWYNAFDYNGSLQVARRIIEGVSSHVTLPAGGKGLDVGCGSGALTIACARQNPQAFMTGLDRWGKEYASFTKPLCENNAKAEGVADRTEFMQGDACNLDFPDETFDAVTSNYVYHNISGVNKQDLLLETLRVLKKGGCFALHDIMSPARYGDMQAFVQKLKDMGYEEVSLIDTTDGSILSPREAKVLSLKGSALLAGRK